MKLLRSLDELAVSTSLPSLCNVYCEIVRKPFPKLDFGGRWHIEVQSLSGRSKALIAVHKEPQQAAATLPYSATQPELLRMLEDANLRALFRPGELVLAQAVPKWGAEETFYLNVPVVLVLRPFQTFGRQLIDFVSPCPRKRYLAITKGAGRPRRARSGNRWGSVGGTIVHELVGHIAADGGCDLPSDEMLLAALRGEALVELICLGLVSCDQMARAVRKVRDAVGTIKEDAKVRELLTRERWQIESDILNNGVAAAPDLLGDRDLVEIKHVGPNSPLLTAPKITRQVQSYLAWSMVEFGVEEVCSRWTGYLVNLHSEVAPESRIRRYGASSGLIGQRLLNRHQILAVAGGNWLPPPKQSECNICEFAFSERSDGETPPLPAVCSYYCQVERHWDCVSSTSACPLLGYCEEHNRWDAYERIDLFNGLRQDLLDEEEEQDAVSAVIEILTAEEGESAGGWIVANLTVVAVEREVLKIELPPTLRLLSFAVPGQWFTLLRNGLPTSAVRYQKRKADKLIFRISNPSSIRLQEGDKVALRRIVGGRYHVREQLGYLDLLQRLGEEPISLRAGRARKKGLAVREHRSLDSIPTDARMVLVDAPGRRRSLEAAQTLLHTFLVEDDRRALVIGSETFDRSPGPHGIELSADILRHTLRGTTGGLSSRLQDVVAQVRSRRVWFVKREDLYDGRLDAWGTNGLTFGLILFSDSETLPLLALQRCMPLAEGAIVLVGQSIAAGPRVESERARGSILFQNTLRFLLDAGAYALPESLGTIDIVKLPIERGAVGLELLPGLNGRVVVKIPVLIHSVRRASAGTPQSGALKLIRAVVPSPGQQQLRLVELELTGGEHSSIKHIRELLKRVSPATLERLSPSLRGQLDTSVLGCAAKVLGITTRNEEGSHELTVRVPRDHFRFIQEHGLECAEEARALVQRAGELGCCVAASPFTAQCLRIAKLAADAHLNLRVSTPQQLGSIPISGRPTLLLSLVGDHADPSFPFPLSEAAALIPMFIGDYASIEIFCSPAVKNHHPLVRLFSRSTVSGAV